MAENISPDYLVIGAGAMAMAFVDTLISSTKKATVVMVDRYDRPGGHWTIAYPFVTLHQPSNVYGVDSRKLGDEKIDQIGLNKGLLEMATGDEIVAYYTRVMHSTFLPSGRVTYYPLHDYIGDGEFHSITTGKRFQVGPSTRIVDSTHVKVQVPAMGPPKYEFSEVNLVIPNALATLKRPYGAYTIIGAGKTAVDACLWLQAQSIDPMRISWIMPRDSWFWERGVLQPLEATPNPEQQMEEKTNATMGATTSRDMFHRLEACGHVFRMDKSVEPTMFRHAIISKAEHEVLKKVQGNIIRLGRVKRIDPDKVTLEQGTYTPAPDTLFIDCTAGGLGDVPIVPVFNGRHITLQVVKFFQPTFSAALIARVESTYDTNDEEFKNSLCEPFPYCIVPEDYPTTLLVSMRNRLKWMAEPKVSGWCEKSRLDFPIMGPPSRDPEKVAAFNASMEPRIKALCEKLEEMARNDIAIAA
ncbi:FAD-dependent pyridine nucleotide-disulfide oxidoreductase [Stemphylium lycopersici]|uniref:FAD-dependent pyridine nucleotide-disulfide oxidoreductase n=1 Tax=Stemphylium lycopersici TaxID=183478 RepID=A0A364NFL9_STELY|nr:FAD-dependent pyridine nucleotide-disulfide oxidoreductase [Stemphylium lycopersici]